MNLPDLITAAEDDRALAEINAWLETQSAEARVAWSLQATAGEHALSSSFGAQAAVSLHLLTQQKADIPIIFIDTGYLFPETYRFVDELSDRLALNLKVYRSRQSPAWQEASYGRAWERGVAGLDEYNRRNKVEPMRRALTELGVRTWYAGLRRSQSESRAGLPVLELQDGRWKLHPLIDWSDRDVGRYLQQHNLPYHPLWHEGYVSIGDRHSTTRWQAGMREEDTRFFGLKRECGIHLDA